MSSHAIDILGTGRTYRPGTAREVLTSSLGSDPYERLEDLAKAGERKAHAEGQAYHLDHMRKVVLSRIMGEIEREVGKCAEGKLERLARADERYEAHLSGTAAAIDEKERAQAAYWKIRAEIEMDQAALIHLNALAKLER